MKKYQEYVIKDGKFVGLFDQMYRAIDDPWMQSSPEVLNDSRKVIVQKYLRDQPVRSDIRGIEIGCGYGHFTAEMNSVGLNWIGTDISPTAIQKASENYPKCKLKVSDFSDFEFYRENKINFFYLSEITWYVLPSLKPFLCFLKNWKEEYGDKIHVVHLLTFYPEGAQKYGREYFTNLQELLNYFGLNYVEYGVVTRNNEANLTYFIAEV